MATIFFDANNVYTKNKNLRKEDVRSLIRWVKDQPHLPDINEAQAILFLHRWSYELEVAKTAVDTYFTVKTHCPNMFMKRNPLNSPYFKDCSEILFFDTLPQKTSKDYNVIFSKFIKSDMNLYDPYQLVKYVDIVFSLNMYERGPSKGYIFVFDMEGFSLEMIAKLDVGIIRKLFYYIQKVLLVKIKQLHMIMHSPYMNTFVALCKPFMEKELADEFYVHNTFNDLYEHVPQSYLPKEYGGSEASLADLHDKIKKKILQNIGLFEWEDRQIVDESKRQNNSTRVVDFLERGSIINGTFEID